MKYIFLVASLILGLHPLMKAQLIIKGRVMDADNYTVVQDAHIIQSDTKQGVVTNDNGIFIIDVSDETGVLNIQAIGYEPLSVNYKIKHDSIDLGTILLSTHVIDLDVITISAGLIKSTTVPVTVSKIEAKTIHNELGDRPLTFSMTNNPGIYTVRNGGGSGDAEISIRGFSQEYVGVLLNGVPINGVENGLIYWSNWLGLSNAATEIQIQKGPGFANTGSNSVGGSINIITNPSASEKSGSIIYQVSSYGNQKLSVSLNSGKLNNGWSISFMGSYLRGPGYIDATYVRGWSYYLALSKELNLKNKIAITVLGAPQKHGQRTLKLSNSENEIYGNKFNKDWGSMDGIINNASENFYHRPFIGINHYLQIDKKKKLTNSVYLIMGNGGGKWSESFNYTPTIFEYRTFSNQIDWPAIYENNATHEGSYTLENGNTVYGYSMNVQTHFLASHVQAGFMSNYEQKLSKNLKLVAGLHYRYFNSYLREEIIDLLGGNFFIEDYSWAVDGVSGRDQIKTVGDIIKVDNNSIINFANVFAQILYENNSWNAFISSKINSNWYQRVDRYNYIQNNKSETILKPGFDIRGGISFKPGMHHLIYANGAIISKAPYFKYVFGNFTNTPVQNLLNENIKTVEIGYKFQHKSVNANLNAFYTDWSNVSMISNEYIQLENNDQTRAMINGLKSVHAGIEFKIEATITRQFSIGGMATLGNYKWKNDVSAQLFNNNNVVVDTVNVYLKDLYVGGTAQQQFGLFANLRLFNLINIKAEWLYNNKIYSNFSPTQRNDISDRDQPYRLPAYNLMNVYIGIPFKFFKKSGLVQINGYNLFNQHYIEWGEDGSEHNLDTFAGFWSFGRNFDFMLKINF